MTPKVTPKWRFLTFPSGPCIWEIGWNGVWVKAWVQLPTAPMSNRVDRSFNADQARATRP